MTLMKFIEDDTLKTLLKHLFAAFHTMYSIATHIMTLETLFSYPAEFAKKHRESPEVQSFKQNPSRESMVAYIDSDTLTHNEIIREDEQGANIWDTLTQHPATRQPRPGFSNLAGAQRKSPATSSICAGYFLYSKSTQFCFTKLIVI